MKKNRKSILTLSNPACIINLAVAAETVENLINQQ